MATAPTNPGVGFIGIGHNTQEIRRNGDKVKIAESLTTIANNSNSLNRELRNLQALFDSLPIPSPISPQELPFITPQILGASGNGSTDDTAYVQAAFDYGTKPVVLYGAYACSALTLPDDLTIFGMPGAILKQIDGAAADDTPFIIATSVSNLYLNGVRIDGNKTGQPGVTNVTGVYMEDVENVRIIDCGVVGTSGDGIGGVGWRNVSIQSPIISDWGIGNGYAGIYHRFTGARAAWNIKIHQPQMDGSGSGSCIKLTAATACPLNDIGVYGGSVKVGTPASGPLDALAVECYSDGDGNFIEDAIVDGVYIDSELAPAVSYGKTWGVSFSQVLRGQVVNCRVNNTGYFFIELIGSQLVARNNRGYNVGSLAAIVSTVMTGDQDGIEIAGNTSVLRAGGQPSSVLVGVSVYIEGTANLTQVDVHDNYIVIQGAQYGYWAQNNGAADLTRLQFRFNEVIGDGTASSFGYVVQNDSSGSVLQTELRSNGAQDVDVMIQRGAGLVNSRIIENIPGSGINTVYSGVAGTGEMIIDIANTEGANFAPPGIQMRGRAGAVINATGDLFLDQVNDRGRLATADDAVDSNPNVLNFQRVNFGSEIQGGVLAVNSRWGGSPNWIQTSTSAYTRAMYAIFGAAAFRIEFAAATNANDADPGPVAFQVVDGNNTVGGNQGVYTGSGFPLWIETIIAIRAGSADPNGSVLGSPGWAYFRSNGTAYIKTSGANTNTGWTLISTGGSFAPSTSTYITQTPDAGLSNEQALSALATGVLKSATGTGVVSIAAFADLPAPGAWTGFTPTVTADTGSVSTSSVAGYYIIWGKLAFVRIAWVGSVSASPHNLTFSLPFSASATGFEQAVSSRVLQTGNITTFYVQTASGSLRIGYPSGVTMANTSYDVLLSGSLEVA